MVSLSEALSMIVTPDLARILEESGNGIPVPRPLETRNGITDYQIRISMNVRDAVISQPNLAHIGSLEIGRVLSRGIKRNE